MFKRLGTFFALILAVVGIGHNVAMAEEYGFSSQGQCIQLCDAPGHLLKTSVGTVAHLFTTANTTPSLVISDGVNTCYADLVQGDATSPSINIKHTNGLTYHTFFDENLCDPTDDSNSFFFMPATTSKTFSFDITAAGNFTIKWGDGEIKEINKTSTTSQTFNHTYATNASDYKIELSGTATAYSSSDVGAILFSNRDDSKVSWIAGCLGCVFPTLENGKQPQFYSTFLNNTDLEATLPPRMFEGIHGQPAAHMFRRTFEGCGKLTGTVPAGFFHIQGTPTERLFSGTFNKTGISEISGHVFKGLSGPGASYTFGSMFANTPNLQEVPAGIFDNITKSAQGLFSQTFMGSNIATVPDKLFASIKTTAASLFSQTFDGCKKLTGIENIFGEFSGNWETNMFKATFNNCVSLDGVSARVGPADDREFLYEIWPSPSDAGDAYAGAENLIDYDCIPKSWGGAGTSTGCWTGDDFDFDTHTFEFVPTGTSKTFTFTIGAAGMFAIDWGDGNTSYIKKKNPGATTVTHTYTDGTTVNDHTIGMGGLATKYSTEDLVAAISFESDDAHSKSEVESISGCLGCIFPTLANGEQPRFVRTFRYNNKLSGEIPSGLFDGVHGQPVSSMFRGLFEYCSSLTTDLPEDLFAAIDGKPAKEMFRGAFREWGGTHIPPTLFHGVKGDAAPYMFAGTFWGCKNLETIPAELFETITSIEDGVFEDTFVECSGLRTIPDNLFATISGAPAASVFHRTFKNCTSLESIPPTLFSGITGSSLAENAFLETFYGDSALSGESAKINDQYLYDIWPNATEAQVAGCYYGATKLDDYKSIPTVWIQPQTSQ